MNPVRHFLKETDFSLEEIEHIFSLSTSLKQHRMTSSVRSLEGQSWGMLFFKNSTRTRISFDVGLNELGAHSLYLDKNAMQISRGETISDTAKVVSRYLHGMVIRAFEHSLVEEFAKEGTIPIINALTDFLHPCQIYTDAYTVAEKFTTTSPCLADLKGKKLVFIGDCNSNMSNSWILGGCLMGMDVVLCGPEKYAPEKAICEMAEKSGFSGSFRFTTDPKDACLDADVIYTDIWVSMGMEAEAEARMKVLMPYQVNKALMDLAKPNALFMHCLPAHAEEEVTQEVLDLPNSIIFDQAENRLHVQKAIMTKLAEVNQN